MSTILSTDYIKCKDHLFNPCIQSMKSLPDHQSSSNSIYKSNVQCPSSSHQDVEVCHSSFLSSKKLSATPFIKLEKKWKYIKDNTYCNHGMYLSMTLLYHSTYRTNYVLYCSFSGKLLNFIHSYITSSKFSRIVVSVCSG